MLKKEQHPLWMLLPAVLFKIALNYETSMALVTVMMQLNNGCQQRVQVAAKGYEQPNHEGNEQEKKDENDD